MKKVLGLLLALMMLTMIGCGTKEEAKEVVANETAVEEVMTVGFIYIGPAADGGWSYSHDVGRKMLIEETGVKTIYKENVPEGPEVKDVIRNMIDQGASVIVAASFGYMDYMAEISADYPDVRFLHCSGYQSTENMNNYFGRIYQARYLSGIVAGLKTEVNKIGYVAAFPIPEVIRGINAFTLGVQSVNPEATVEVVWTSTWYDPAKEKDAAIALLDKGADVISQHQDTSGPQQAAEERGAWAIGYHSDMSESAPKANLTSAIWNWGPFYIDQINAIKDGTWTNEAHWEGLKEGIVELSPLTANVAPGTAEAVEKVKASIISGDFKVFQGEIKNQAGEVIVKKGEALSDGDMLGMNYFVEGVIGKIQ